MPDLLRHLRSRVKPGMTAMGVRDYVTFIRHSVQNVKAGSGFDVGLELSGTLEMLRVLREILEGILALKNHIIHKIAIRRRQPAIINRLHAYYPRNLPGQRIEILQRRLDDFLLLVHIQRIVQGPHNHMSDSS